MLGSAGCAVAEAQEVLSPFTATLATMEEPRPYPTTQSLVRAIPTGAEAVTAVQVAGATRVTSAKVHPGRSEAVRDGASRAGIGRTRFLVEYWVQGTWGRRL